LRYGVVFAVGLLMLSCSPLRAWADATACVVRMEGDATATTGIIATGRINEFRDTPTGLLLGADNGLFRYDGTRTVHIGGDPTGGIGAFRDAPGGLLLVAEKGLFHYDGTQTAQIGGDPTGGINEFRDTPTGLLLGAENGLFRYDGKRIVHIDGDPTGFIRIRRFHDAPGGLLLKAEKGLFRYDGTRTVHIGGDPTGFIDTFFDTPVGLLLGADNGLFRYDGTRTVHIGGDPTGDIHAFRDAPGGLLLVAEKGLFHYDGTQTAQIGGDPTGFIREFHDTPAGLLLGAEKGLFRYDGKRIVHVEGDPTGFIDTFRDTPAGLLLGAEKGLFRYDGSRTVHVEGDPTGYIGGKFHVTPAGLLFSAANGLFHYDGTRIVHVVEGSPTGSINEFHDTPTGLLLGAEKGLFRVIVQSLSTATVVLENASQLSEAATNQTGILTRWTMIHPCSAVLDRFNLHVIATSATDAKPARNFQSEGGAMSFEATVPVPAAGTWTFRVVSTTGEIQTNIGQPSEPIPFVAPGSPAWFAVWWKVIATSSVALLAALNLAVVAAARYSSAAWRLATDEFWGKKALILQSLLLRHWRGAQLWLLDLYVRERRKTAASNSVPYLPVPLTGRDGKIADSDAVLVRLPVARHLWVQGGTGMGKTAMFWHLRQTHFGGLENTSFAIFRRDGYVLVPIEARRFPEAPFEEKGASAWVIACVLSVLSEGGLSFEDRGLLRAMLSKGTLAIAIDGLNEVARGQAVSAFAAEFPAAPLFVTSQEPGEFPFEVWRLPGTIAEHVDGLLTLYLGAQRGEALASRLRDSGLMQHLRSGYDVRLVIDLAEADPEGAKLPHDRIGLYRAAVAAAWPEGDQRLELLQAAAWKLMSERGPNEDKRRLKPDEDAPKDLLEQLEAVRERSGRSIRLIRAAPPYYEFVHDQMNAYLAACWFTGRATIAAMKIELEATKIWQDGLEAQRTLWGFVAAMLDRASLEALWIFAGDDDRRAVLGRALAERAEREGWPLTRPAAKVFAAAEG